MITPEQRARAERIRDEHLAVQVALGTAKAETVALEQTLEQIIQDARAGLTPIPKPGEEWAADRNYTTGDTASEGGVLYEALRYSRGKRPSESPEHWIVSEPTVIHPAWSSIEDGTIIEEGTIVEQDGHLWRCSTQHFKSTVYKPKAGSSRWELVT